MTGNKQDRPARVTKHEPCKPVRLQSVLKNSSRQTHNTGSSLRSVGDGLPGDLANREAHNPMANSTKTPDSSLTMQRPSTTPCILQPIASRTESAKVNRYVSVRTGDGQEVRTRDSCESSRTSSAGSSSGKTGANDQGRFKLPQPKLRKVCIRISLPKRKALSAVVRFSYIQKALRDTEVAKLIASGQRPSTAPGNIRQDNPENNIGDDASEDICRPTSKTQVHIKEPEESDPTSMLVLGTEHFHEVVNRLCRPTVASVARASPTSIRSREAMSTLTASSPLPPKKEVSLVVPEGHVARRFLGERKVTADEVAEIVSRLHPPSGPDTLMTSRRLLARASFEKHGIVNSYMWKCGGKLPQSQWEMQTIQIAKQNFLAQRPMMEQRLRILPDIYTRHPFGV